MKKYIIAAIILLSTVLPGFVQASNLFEIDRGVIVEMHEFRERGDSLYIVYSVHMDRRAIVRWRGMSLTPSVEAGARQVFLPSFVVLGSNKDRVLTRYYTNHRFDMPNFDIDDWRTASSFRYRIAVPYQAWMDDAELIIHREIQTYRARSRFDSFALNNRVELEPRVAYQVQPRVEIVMPAREPKILERSGQAFLDFPVGQHTILPNFRRNPVELARIQDAVRVVVSNPDAQLQSIYIRGYASPEGTAASNQRLSENRAIALQNHLRNMFNLPVNVFRTSAGGEDWDGLVRLLNENRVFVQNQDRILHIITTEFDLDRREAQIRAASPQGWTVMLNTLFPYLRRADYRIYYTIRDYSVEDAINLIDRNPRDLSHYEMFLVAEYYGRGSERANLIITDVILQFFPDDELAHNNAAALQIQRGDLALARVHLERAGNSGAALNNRGVLALLEGNLERAEDYLVRAQAAGSEDAAHNRNELRLKREDNERMERLRNR